MPANQLTGTDPLGFTHNSSFDAENRIRSLDAGAAVYTYDGDGNRMVKNLGGTGMLYWHGADGEILAVGGHCRVGVRLL